MGLIKKLFFAYLLLIALAVGAYGVSRFFAPPRDPNTLFTIYVSSIRSLDPTLIADVGTSDIMGHVWETLYNYRYGGKADELFPQLAADFPKISPDKLTYTIPLRRGIRFYDPQKRIWPDGIGPELTAKDVVYSWKRFADFHSAAPSYSTVFQGNLVGLDDFNAYTEKTEAAAVDYDRPVEGLVALDDHTVQIKLTQPIPNFLQLTAYLGAAVVSRDAVEKLASRGLTMKENPIATGPYCLEEYLPDQRLTLRANPIYRGRPDVDAAEGAKLKPEDRLPHIQRIQFDYTLELLPAWHLFLQKRYDVMSIPKETYASAINPKTGELNPDLAAKGIVLLKRPDPGLYYVQFNMTDPVLGKNKPLRQAMSLALDRERFIRVYRNGRGSPATGIFPPDASLFDPAYASPWCKFDPEAAKKKMLEATLVNGGPLPPLKLQMGDTDTDSRQYAEFFCRCWAAIGLNVTPEYNTYAHYLELLDAKSYQITYTGWVPDYPDEKTYLRLFDATLTKPPGSNTCGYVNDTYQHALEQSLTLDRSPDRDKLYLQMRNILDDDLPVAPMFYPQIHSLRYNWVTGYQIPLFNSGFLAYQSLDTAKRRAALIGISNGNTNSGAN